MMPVEQGDSSLNPEWIAEHGGKLCQANCVMPHVCSPDRCRHTLPGAR